MPRDLGAGVAGGAFTRVALPICADQGVRGTSPAEVRVVAGARWGVWGVTGALPGNVRVGVGVVGAGGLGAVVFHCVRAAMRGVEDAGGR